MKIQVISNFTKTALLILLSAVVFTASGSAATFVVTNSFGCGEPGSFADAVLRANAAPTDDTIVFGETVRYYTCEKDNSGLTIADNGTLTIEGRGAAQTILDGYLNFGSEPQMITIGQGARVVINNVTITRGNGTIGVLENASLILNNSVISKGYNIRGFGGRIIGGGAIAGYEGSRVEVNNSTLSENSSTLGGAIYAKGILIINNSVITDNSSGDYGGGIHSNNITIRNSVISDNLGGGLDILGTANISGCLISNNDNRGRYGGGLFARYFDISNTTFSGNRASYGGGIFMTFGFNDLSKLKNVTIADNTATVRGGGISRSEAQDERLIGIGNTIVADNIAPDGPDIFGRMNSLGFNIIGNTGDLVLTGDQTGNRPNTDPLLAPLADNGGDSQTYALYPDSPAINAGSNALAVDFEGVLQFDQRGSPFQRIVGNRVDIGAFELQTALVNTKTLFDFDGDRKADKVVFRPSNSTWYQLLSDTGIISTNFGLSTDKIVPADYDADGKTDIAVFRPSNGTWYIFGSAIGFRAIQFGSSNDIPVPGDYDADGKDDVAVFRPSNGTWYIKNSSAGFSAVLFGISTDKPVAADYDGDGKTDVAVYRPGEGNWYILGSTSGFQAVNFGISDDKLVPADYDGDGRADVAVYRGGFWYILGSTAGFSAVQFGTSTDKPVPADYDGDGKTDVAVYRNGNWYILETINGFNAVQYGASNDVPAPNAFVRQPIG